MNLYKTYLKTVFDIFISIMLLIVVSPLIILIYISLLFLNRGQVLFKQQRPGKDGRIFYIYKFQTMNNNMDSSGRLLPDENRISFIGKVLRKTSLDELPQLFNVIKGDLSLVGPRPLLVEYLPLYDEEQKKRHIVKPGITGWAQVNGRNAISWQKKLELDVWYVKNVSFSLDIKIMILTLIKVLRTEGISSSTSVTMEKFTGND